MGASLSKRPATLAPGRCPDLQHEAAWTFNPPIEILEEILLLVYLGYGGLIAEPRFLQNASRVNRTWYAICARIKPYQVVLRRASDLRLFRPDLFHTSIVGPTTLAERPHVLDPRRIAKLCRRQVSRRTRRIDPSIAIMADPAEFIQGSLCHSLECQMGPSLLVALKRGQGTAEILRYLPNLRFFGLRTSVLDSRVFDILEELSDRGPHPDTCGAYGGGPSTIDRPHRRILRRLELSFEFHGERPSMSMRPGYSLGVSNLSLDMGEDPYGYTAFCVAHLLSHCRPGKLRSVRISGDFSLARDSLCRALAMHGCYITHMTIGAGRADWGWYKWLNWSISSSLRTWDIVGFLKRGPLSANACIGIEGGPKYDGRFLRSPEEDGAKEVDNRSDLWDQIKSVCDNIGIKLVPLPLFTPITGPY